MKQKLNAAGLTVGYGSTGDTGSSGDCGDLEKAQGLARLAEAGFVAEAGMPMQVLTGGDRGVQAQVIGVLFAE